MNAFLFLEVDLLHRITFVLHCFKAIALKIKKKKKKINTYVKSVAGCGGFRMLVEHFFARMNGRIRFWEEIVALETPASFPTNL